MKLRRLSYVNDCCDGLFCPNVFETENGDFAIVGKASDQLKDFLPSDAGCAEDEQIVVVPRAVLLDAAAKI